MCFQLYLGAHAPCPEIPYQEPPDRSIDETALFVVNMPERSAFQVQVAGLTTPYQYHVGIMSCGCGFALDAPANGYDDDRLVRNHAQLAEYIAQCLAHTSPITLRTSWAGDEALPADATRTIALATLRDPAFFFAEREETLVYRELPVTSGT